MRDVLEASAVLSDDSETLSEHVFRRIQAAIVRGDIAPGSKISEPELSRAYGISRGTLREAIHLLETDGLISVRRGNVGGAVGLPPAGVGTGGPNIGEYRREFCWRSRVDRTARRC